MIVISNYQTMTCTEHSASAMNRCLLAKDTFKLEKIKLTWIKRILEVRISCLLWHNNFCSYHRRLFFFLIIVTGRIPGIWSVLTQICYSPLRNSIASALEKTPSSQTLQVAYSYLWWQSHVWSLKFHQPWHVATSFALPWHNEGQTLYEVTLYFLV